MKKKKKTFLVTIERKYQNRPYDSCTDNRRITDGQYTYKTRTMHVSIIFNK